MKNKLIKGMVCLQPVCLMLITIKKEKQSDLIPSLPSACVEVKATRLNISETKNGCCTLMPIVKPTTALLPANLQYK